MAAAAGAGSGVRNQPVVTGAQHSVGQLGSYAVHVVYQEIEKRGLTVETGKLIFDFAKIKPDHPYKRSDDEQGIVYDLPSMPPPPSSNEPCCFFYGLRRILTAEQTQSPLAHACMVRQITIAAGEQMVRRKAQRERKTPSPAKLLQVRERASQVFFRGLGLDLRERVDAVHREGIMIGLRLANEGASEPLLAGLVEKRVQADRQKIPNDVRSFERQAAEQEMPKQFGLQPLPYAHYATEGDLISTLRQFGPFTLTGEFGVDGTSVANRPAPQIQSIVVVGVKNHRVWWVNPLHGTPQNPQEARVFATSFTAFTDQVGLGRSDPTLSRYRLAVKEKMALAHYNPLFALNGLECNALYQTLETYSLRDTQAKAIFDFCERECDSPPKLYDDPGRLVYAMPRGKLDKTGQVVVQNPQKGGTCSFYATKRILTLGQVRSEHGRHCSQYRKALTRIDEEARKLNTEREAATFQQARIEAMTTFFTQKGISLKQAIAEGQALLGNRSYKFFLATQLPVLDRPPSALDLQCAEIYLNDLIIEGYGLKGLFYTELQTKERLFEVLRTRGPLVVGGQFGQQTYGGVEPTLLAATLGEHRLYGWPKGTPYTPHPKGHAIVVIGMEIEAGGKCYVYWNDPNDASDPQDLQAQRVFKTSFETFIDRLSKGNNPVNGNKRPVAHYNPLLMKK